MPTPPGRARLELLLRPAVALLSLGAAAIHGFVIESHFTQYWLFGVFFSVLALLQGAWAVAVVLRPSLRLLTWGAVGNTAVVGVWLVTRTIGVPVGPEAGQTEAVGFIDAAATAFEALLVVGLLVLLNQRLANRTIPREFVPAGVIALGVMVATITQDAVRAVHADGAAEASGTGATGDLASHLPHLILIGTAVVAFVAYALIDLRRQGRPSLPTKSSSRDRTPATP